MLRKPTGTRLVYVDNMRAGFGGMIMYHMIADSSAELIQMVNKIGVQRKWLQWPGTYREHFDICLTKRKLAIQAGAVELTQKELARKLYTRRPKV